MMKLETVVLQQREKEGGHREHKPGQGIGVEENNFAEQQASERNGSVSYPNLVLLCLPSKQSPHPQEVIIRPEREDGEAGRH
jgi:hypothetical protein